MAVPRGAPTCLLPSRAAWEQLAGALWVGPRAGLWVMRKEGG